MKQFKFIKYSSLLLLV